MGSWPGGEALWHWGDFVPAAFMPRQVLSCPARGVQLRLRAAGLWLIQQHWGCVLSHTGLPQQHQSCGEGWLPARAVPILQPQPSTATQCRALGAVQGGTEGIWAMSTFQGMPLQCQTLAALPAHSLDSLSPLQGKCFHCPEKGLGFFYLPFPATDREEPSRETLMAPPIFSAHRSECKVELGAFSEHLKHPGDSAHIHRNSNPKEICQNQGRRRRIPIQMVHVLPVPTSLQLFLPDPALQVSSQSLGAISLANTIPLLFGSHK